MKITNKKELQKIAFNHSSDTDFQEFMKLYKKCTKNIFFLVIDTTLLHQIALYVLEGIYYIEYKS